MISLPIIFSKYYKLFIFTISSSYPSPIKYNFPLEFRLQNKNKKRYIPNSCFTKNFNVKLRYACKTFDNLRYTDYKRKFATKASHSFHEIRKLSKPVHSKFSKLARPGSCGKYEATRGGSQSFSRGVYGKEKGGEGTDIAVTWRRNALT